MDGAEPIAVRIHPRSIDAERARQRGRVNQRPPGRACAVAHEFHDAQRHRLDGCRVDRGVGLRPTPAFVSLPHILNDRQRGKTANEFQVPRLTSIDAHSRVSSRADPTAGPRLLSALSRRRANARFDFVQTRCTGPERVTVGPQLVGRFRRPTVINTRRIDGATPDDRGDDR